MKWPGNATYRPDYQIRRYRKSYVCACQLVTIYSNTLQGIWADNRQKSSTSTFFFFFLPQEVANNVPRLKEKDQAPYIALILVALVTILQHSSSSWRDENVRMRIGRSNGSGWVHLYWHRPFKRYKCVLWDGGCGQKKNKQKKWAPQKLCTLTKSAPNICAHCPLPPPKTSSKIHCST